MQLEGKTKRNFGIAGLGKKIVFHTEICEFRDLRFLNNSYF